MKSEQENPCTLKSLTDLAEQVPFNLFLIDRNYNVIDANRQFEERFGEWKGKHCFETFKDRSTPCPDCRAMKVFGDGCAQVMDEDGRDRHGQPCNFSLHLAPLRNAAGGITHVMGTSTDVAATKRWQQEECNLLFDRVPCYIAVIDRNYQITRANEKFRKSFGEAVGKPCFEAFKGFDSPCPKCPAKQTFDDGSVHFSLQVGRLQDGSVVHYIVSAAPLAVLPDGVSHVIEIATDITAMLELEGELQQTHDLYESLLHNTASGVLVLNEQDQISFINRSAREILQWTENAPPSKEKLLVMLPARFFEQELVDDPVTVWKEAAVRTTENNEVPVLFRTVELHSRGMKLGRAAFFRDLRPMKKLEKEKLDAERLGAVGQTVAGLAHTIKNLLMGLEGGMYLMDTGLKQGDVERITEGWEVLQINFEKTTTLVKDFLSFAKGRLPDLRVIDPNKVMKNIYDLYHETASRQGVRLVLDLKENIELAWLDPEGIEASLTNMLSNGIDAVILRGNVDGQVVLRTRDEGDDLILEVEDNGCGMDWDIKQKIFTTFFTTKGGEGTGLGLLTTRKIIQEHCGKIEVDTKEGIGTTFRVRLPRLRLKELAGETQTSCRIPAR
jgi:histidine kinase